MTWQPIETAPRDQRILLYRPETTFTWSQIVAGHYDDNRYARKPAPYWDHDLVRVTGVRDARESPPTHWMPLPEPPK